MNIKNIAIFSMGMVAGCAITWRYFKDKYKKQADEEIASVVTTFSRKKKELKEQYEKLLNDENELNDLKNDEIPSKNDYDKMLETLGYVPNPVDPSTIPDEDYIIKTEETESFKQPYVISPDEFGNQEGVDLEDWPAVLWRLTSDGWMVNEDDEIVGIEEYKDILGEDNLTRFGEYEPEILYVRNEKEKHDYEVIREVRTFDELFGDNY